MPWPELEAAILAHDAEAMVRELSTWSEAERETAQNSLHQLWDKYKGKDREHTPMYCRLACVGISGLNRAKDGSNAVNFKYACQIICDRKPVWQEKWVRELSDGHAPLYHWIWLVRYGLIDREPPASLRAKISWELVWLFSNYSSWVDDLVEGKPRHSIFQEFPWLIEYAYDAPLRPLAGGLGTLAEIDAIRTWGDIIILLNDVHLLDRSRMIESCIRGVSLDASMKGHGSQCFAVLLALKPSIDEFVAVTSLLLDVLNTAQPAVASQSLELLLLLDQHGKLDRRLAIPGLIRLIQQKAKSHAVRSLKLLEAWSEQDLTIRPVMLEQAQFSLGHSAVDVQRLALAMLEREMQSADDQIIANLRSRLSVVSASLSARLDSLLNRLALKQNEIHAASPTPSVSQQTARSNPIDGNNNALSAEEISPTRNASTERLDAIDPSLRSMLGLDELANACQSGTLPNHAHWPILAGKALHDCQPIVPIQSVEELIETIGYALEVLDSGDDYERVLDGLARLSDQRLPDFHQRTDGLVKRINKWVWFDPGKGILARSDSHATNWLLRYWLGADRFDKCKSAYLSGSNQVVAGGVLDRRIWSIAARVRKRETYQLLSTPTHAGGWLCPEVFVQRLLDDPQETLRNQSEFKLALLRLAPDGRVSARKKAQALSPPVRDIVLLALGEEVGVQEMVEHPTLWATAYRARDPHVVIQQKHPLASLVPEVGGLNPADYLSQLAPRNGHQCSVSCMAPVNPIVVRGLEFGTSEPWSIQANPTYDQLAEVSNQLGPARAESANEHIPSRELLTFFWTDGAEWTAPWIASHWPIDLEWYWAAVCRRALRRVETKESISEANRNLFLPLMEKDRPMTRNAGRAIWFAVISADTNARAGAMDAFIAVVEDGRADLGFLSDGLLELGRLGWVKSPRIRSALTELAQVSLLHRLTAYDLLSRYLRHLEDWPKDVGILLESLLDWAILLGLPPCKDLATRLSSLKSGKGKSIAAQLLKIVDQPELRRSAIDQLFAARLERAKRFSTR